QMPRLEALDADGQAIHAGRVIAGEAIAFEGPRVGFERDFGIRDERQPRANPREERVDGGFVEHARRSSADEDRLNLPSPDARQRELEVGEQGLDVLVLRNVAAYLVRIEIAIRALSHAPWNVHVQRERRQRREARSRREVQRDAAHGTSACRRASSARIAWPRWERAFLISSGNSAPVMPVSMSSKCGS